MVDSFVSETRLDLMQKGALLGMNQIENMLSRGLIHLEKDPGQLRHLAGLMIDHKLNGVSKQVKSLEELVGKESKWPETTMQVLTRAHHALWTLGKIDSLQESEQLDLLIYCGLTIRKDQLTAHVGDNGFQTWYQLNVVESKEDRLTVRKVYFLRGDGQLATQIDFIFGRAKSKPFPSGRFYDLMVYFYPGKVPDRIYVEKAKRSDRTFDLSHVGFDSVDLIIRDAREKLMANPWLYTKAYWLNGVILQKDHGDIFVVDKHGQALRVEVSDLWYRRLELAAGETKIDLLVEWQNGHMMVMCVHCYGQLFSVA